MPDDGERGSEFVGRSELADLHIGHAQRLDLAHHFVAEAGLDVDHDDRHLLVQLAHFLGKPSGSQVPR